MAISSPSMTPVGLLKEALQVGHHGVVVLAFGGGREEDADDPPVEREQPAAAVRFDVVQGGNKLLEGSRADEMH
ncbi:hypothetical protein FIBSPDRAFT_880051 [Athelia psychrophila]|uniref:Uncharacterized protein n=1 Tax=Athelia psychrophila TaxID=1759441 RepID=A0A167TAI3_9AGAM|nr:hypothetical protein FIBSPDRAFT_880051 [Fibularhizoctonia sp. CBS 109695]